MYPQQPIDPASGPQSPPVLFDKHTIDTPEQLQLDFPVAGIGSRFLALAIDTLIQFAVTIVGVIAFALLPAMLPSPARAGNVWLLGGLGFVFFLLFFGYFAIFEVLWNGQTPGKRAIGLRVIKDSGRPLTVAESVGRNLFRIVDQLPGFYALGMVVALLNSRNKRLGDLVAGSVVIRESLAGVSAPIWQIHESKAPAARVLGAASLTLDDLTLIDAFLNRRNELAPDVRSSMAARILDQLRPKLAGVPEQGLSAEAMLESLAYERRSTGAM